MTRKAATEANLARPEIEATPAILSGMQPAYRHRRTGESHLSQSTPGVPDSVYAFIGLPDEWIVERDSDGEPLALHPDIIAGYWRDAKFIALGQLTQMPLDA
ncbi:hypothetical protein [Granulosicoccus antarcticus]|uniref:Uncharacterized protein n=1 Tax=Granulosicoccus antarcticus IMCC3135 TaxID=1192854 RepID=A0A2Z2NKX3_9GAMM|nr:hypothetical protein [Granulosicoccus antarcticus]ASJ71793.1 hypothetical protein IMCC3135_08470 [Granulosicoccus antarcticus IMCC3135]